jgi:hypothetical protein
MQIKHRPHVWLFTIIISVFIFAILLTIIVTSVDEPAVDSTKLPALDPDSGSIPTTALPPELESETSQQPSETDPPVPPIILIDIPVLFSELVYQETDTFEVLDTFIKETDDAITFLQNECGTVDKYTAEAIVMMLEEVDRLTTEQTIARQQRVLVIKWVEKTSEYPYATKLWQYLKTLDYSDIACAGILGNVMAECGGLTLDLQPFVYDPTGKYYGMFQWSLRYFPETAGMSFEEQLEYYRQTSGPTFKTWGKQYADGFTLEDFNELSDPRETALAFAKIYERCASWTYEIRQNLAEVAYQYFVLDFEELSVQ